MNILIKQNQGFTLLEVMVAITLTALVLGNLFALQSQSKKLSFKAQTKLAKIINYRAYLNAGWISDQATDHYMDEFESLGLAIDNQKKLIKPANKISPDKFYLESYTLVNKNNEIIFTGTRMKSSMINNK